uniref:Activating transcription factor 7 interacting protein n=1 Tax=Hippocampus comes TaxID=109280 RepID=A0A3Q3DIJ0_HIPCM
MEVVVTEEKKKIFRARKTMKISDRQQLEALHSTLLTAASEPSPPPPLMNGSHREDGQKDAEQNSHQDSNSPIATSPASMTSLSSPAPFLSLNLSPSPVPSQSPKDKDESLSGPSSDSSIPSPSSSADVKREKDVEEGTSKNQSKKGLLKQDKMEVTIVKVEAKKEKMDSGSTSKPSLSEEKNCTSGIKRTLSEGCDNGEQTIKRDGKRPKMDQGELEAQLELKITAKAGSHHKLEKIVQKLVCERLRDLEMTILEKGFQELKGRVDKIDCTTKHQVVINTLQAKIARLSKKFGEANQASENKRKQESLAASTAIAAAAAAVTTAAKTASVANTPQVQRCNRLMVVFSSSAKSGPLVPTPVSTTAAMVSQAPIIKLITSSSNAVSTLATGITTQSPTGTLLLKTAPAGGVMTGQPLIIQLPVSMTNGQGGTLVNFPVSSLPTAGALTKPKTTASTTTFIIKPAPVTTTAMSSGQLALSRAVYQGGAGGITTPNAGVSVTPARALLSPVSVAGAMSTASTSTTSGPAATGSAAPGPPQGTSLTSKTDNQATGTTPSKAATPVTRPKGAVIDLTEDDDDVQVTGVKAATVPSPSLTQRPHPVNVLSSPGARSSPQTRTSSITLPALPIASTPTNLPPEAQRTSPPQQPQLKLVPSQSGIVLSWCVSETDHSCAAVESYHLYAYHQDNSNSNSSQQHWKKIGEVKALPLPMACTLTQFQSGSTYHFAVRAKDIYGRFGSFCEPQCTNVINPSSN